MQTHAKIKLGAWKFPDAKSMQSSLRKFGSFMAGMIMPIIGVIIAWGFFTAIVLAAKTIIAGNIGIKIEDWNKDNINHSAIYLWNMDYIIGWGISSIIPIMVGYYGGKQIHQTKGAIIGLIAAMGVIGGSFNPLFNETMVAITGDQSLLGSSPPVMILGAMIAGPLAAFIYKKLEKLWINRIPSGFEMLVNNLSIGLIGLVLMFASFWSIALIAAVLQSIFYLVIKGLNQNQLLWLMPMFIETEKILFLNNAVNHGILGPLGYFEVQQFGQSPLFFLDPNPGMGMGLLLAYFLFGKRDEKSQSAAAMPVHFLGGIHEVYFPFVLVKPLNLLWLIGGGTFAAAMLQVFNVGGLFTPSPGSIIMNYLALNPEPMNYAGLSVAIFGGLAITCALTSTMLILERIKKNERVYFNPVAALLMAKVNRLMSTKDVVSINKQQPVKSIAYVSEPTNKKYEWEIIDYKDGSKEELINLNDKKKTSKFAYLCLTKLEAKAIKEKIKNKQFVLSEYKESIKPETNQKLYTYRKFATDKEQIIKNAKTDKIIDAIIYEERVLEKKTRTVEFEPTTNKKGLVVEHKPLVQQIWYLKPEETLADLAVKKVANKSTLDTSKSYLELLKSTDKIVFACEAGMGSSAMGAGIVRKMLKEEKITGINVINFAIKDVPPNTKVIICQNIFKDLVTSKYPDAYVYTIDQFLKKTEYANLIDQIIELRGK